MANSELISIAPIPPRNTLGPAERSMSSAVKIFKDEPACSKPLQKRAASMNNQKMTPNLFFSSAVCPPKKMMYPKKPSVISTATRPRLPAKDSSASSTAPVLTKNPKTTKKAANTDTIV